MYYHSIVVYYNIYISPIFLDIVEEVQNVGMVAKSIQPEANKRYRYLIGTESVEAIDFQSLEGTNLINDKVNETFITIN